MKHQAFTVLRVGGDLYMFLKENYSSASAVRAVLRQGKRPDGNLPDYVLNDLPKALETHLDVLEKYAVLSRTTKEIASVCDCT